MKILSKNPEVTFTPEEVVIGNVSSGEEKHLELALKADENITDEKIDFTIEMEGDNCETYSKTFEVALAALEDTREGFPSIHY